MPNKKTLHLRTNSQDRKPTSDILDHGAIAINYFDGSETLFIKNTSNNIVEFKDSKYYDKIISDNELVVATALTTIKDNVGLSNEGTYVPFEEANYIGEATTLANATEILDTVLNSISEENSNLKEVTYFELANLKNEFKLIPGCWYRITDYETTSCAENTIVGGNRFDILVLATDTNVLSEEAKAIKHGSTTTNFYSITSSNDSSLNGVYTFIPRNESFLASDGQTYWLHDAYALGGLTNTFFVTRTEDFVSGDTLGVTTDKSSVDWSIGFLVGETISKTNNYFDNSDLNAWKIWYSFENDSNRFDWACTVNGRGVIYRMIDEHQNDCPYDFKNILFSSTLNQYSGMAIGEFDDVSSVNADESEELAELLSDTSNNYLYTFGGSSDETIQMKGTCGTYSNTIKPSHSIDSKKLTLPFILFETMCYNNTLGFDNFNNKFSAYCNNNTLCNGCNNNILGNSCNNNYFGEGCGFNTLKSLSTYNSFISYCGYNNLEFSCSYNSFGIGCAYNTLGGGCLSNTFGNECESNIMGPTCKYNQFGNNCKDNKFYDSSTLSNIRGFCDSNTFSNSVSNVNIYNTSEGSETNVLRNVFISNGVSGTVEIQQLNADYQIKVGKNSSGIVKVYCEADLIQ